jgi:hypothetical protein
VCYADNQDGYVNAKAFTLFKDQEYPDQGAHVEVWLNNNPLYLEVEVVSPIVELAANGGRYTFTEDWFAARLKGPVLSVNSGGAVQEFLQIKNGRLTGRFGVFYSGTAKLAYIGRNGEDLGLGPARPVTPLETLVLDETDTIPPGTALLELAVYDPSGQKLGIITMAPVGSSSLALTRNFPNPFKATTTLQVGIPENGDADLAVFDLRGRKVAVLLSGNLQAGSRQVVWNAEGISSGIYIARLKFKGSMKTVKMVLAR